MPYIRVFARETRLKQREFLPFVPIIGKQRLRHYLFIFIKKKKKNFPFTHSSVAKEELETPPFFSHIECKFTRQEHIKRWKKFSGLIFFLQFILCDKLPYICVHFWEKGSFLIQPFQFNLFYVFKRYSWVWHIFYAAEKGLFPCRNWVQIYV